MTNNGTPVKTVRLSAEECAGFSEGSLAKLTAAGFVVLQ